MVRIFWGIVAILGCLWVLLQLGVFPEPVTIALWRILGPIYGLACPLFFLMLFYAPGTLQSLTEPWAVAWRRWGVRSREREDLERKIAHMNKAHHKALLGNLLLRQNRYAEAAGWFEQALAQEPDSLDARYRLALCHFERADYPRAAELLEEVHQLKPEYDYGQAYLRLAETQQQLGNNERADEVYRLLLKFYPGQPEGSYHYALLLAGRGEIDRARQLMQDVIFAVRHSPRFQRRRNRHWMLKARWWMWMHRAG